MSDSVRRQPTQLPRPWDCPGKNTGVGCHFLLQCMKVKSESEVAQPCLTLSDPMDCSRPGSSVHGIFQARVLEWGAIAFSGNKTNISQKYNEVQRFIFTYRDVSSIQCSLGTFHLHFPTSSLVSLLLHHSDSGQNTQQDHVLYPNWALCLL